MHIALQYRTFSVLHLSSVKYIDVCNSEIFSFFRNLLSPINELSCGVFLCKADEDDVEM